MTSAPTPRLARAAPPLARALTRGTEALLARQRPDGSWQGELESNASITAEYILLRRLLGIPDPQREAAAVHYLRHQQRPDGGVPIAPELPGDISVTAEVFCALRAAGVPADDPAARAARAFVAARGGTRATRFFTRLWLATAGLWSWEELPSLPPEWLILPGHLPGSIYDLASWARATMVPLMILRTLRTQFPLDQPSPGELPLGPRLPPHGSRGLRAADAVMRAYGRAGTGPGRRHALDLAERWVVQHQEVDGSWAGIQPPWVYSILALRARGYPLDHPIVQRGLASLETFGIEDEQGFRLQACVSPVWDTALALWAVLEAGVPAQDPAVQRAIAWLLDKEVRALGDWAVRRPGAAPGGWPFELHNDWYPDTDDTAVVCCALAAAGHRRDDGSEAGAAIDRALRWLLVMQDPDGGYGAFDVANTRTWVERLPASDFGEVLDPPSPDVTAHVAEALVRCGSPDGGRGLARAMAWLRRSEAGGSGAYFGRWGVNYVYGTAAAATAYAARGTAADGSDLRRAGRWLARHQQEDGAFGESLRSYQDPRWRGVGTATPSQTAWGLLGLQAAPGQAAAAQRAAGWLAQHQDPDGGWTDDTFTGTGFPRAFYLRYHLYAHTFPVLALARVVRSPERPERPEAA
ncbi:MAG TPA: squalene--hopene cyclase [Candidatus Dormibacteraeota bacterium]|nr:squalene--hopene cyclase [Candidatus Dormibacteraeota bacterium]